MASVEGAVLLTVADFRRRVESDIESLVVDLQTLTCLLYTSDAADERSSVDLGGRRIIKKKQNRA